MAGQVLIALASAAFACDDPEAQVRVGTAALLSMELTEADAALSAAEDALGCARVDATVLADFWILEGAIATFRKDDLGAKPSFAAAARVAPGHFPTTLGPALEAAWKAASSGPRPQGVISVSGADGYTVALDTLPAPGGMVDAGLHLVQVLDGDVVRFGRVVQLGADTTAEVEAGLPPKVAEAPPPDPVPIAPVPSAPRPRSAGVRPFAALGASVTASSAVRVGPSYEPGARLSLPLELGATFGVGPGWLRGAAGVAPIPNGTLLYQTADAEVRATRFPLEGHVAGGATLDRTHVGALAGISLPGRSTIRAVGGFALPGLPLVLEGRAGVNLVAAERGPEPALSVHALVLPPGGSR